MIHRILSLFLITVAQAAAAPAGPAPFWETPAVAGDPLFFVREDGAPAARAPLLFAPATPPVIRSATLETLYERGKDYEWNPGSREIILTAKSRIPFHTVAELHPPPHSPNSYNGFRDGKSWMLFGEGRWFHDRRAVAAYTTEEKWDGPRPVAAPEAQLARSRAKLKAGGSFKLVTLGDSISTGANASGAADAPPRQPGYHDLVAAGLTARFGVTVTEKNLSVGGMDSAWGLLQVPAVVAEKPDLVLLAFGMNDASGRRTADDFSRIIGDTVQQIRTGCPDCDVIVISPMTANPEWTHAAPELYPAYAAVLAQRAGPGCAFADVTSVWSAVVRRKSALCLTGNGLNHPNDFGHRLYADVVLAVTGGRP